MYRPSMALDSLGPERLFECCICLGGLKDPRGLPCLHSYCLECLEGLVSAKEGSRHFRCPQCKKQLSIPEGGVSEFPKNFFLNKVRAREESNVQPLPAPTQCERHDNPTVQYFCKTCALPACADCVIEDHRDHVTERLAIRVEYTFKPDMAEVSKLAEKRSEVIKQKTTELNDSQDKMEKDLNRASQEISQRASALRDLINKQEGALLSKVDTVRDSVRELFDKAQEELKVSKETTTSIHACAETLCAAVPDSALSVALQAPANKQLFLTQQDVSLPSIVWNFKINPVQLGDLFRETLLGNARTESSARQRFFNEEKVTLEEPLAGFTLECGDESAMVCGIQKLDDDLLCIAHAGSEHLYVYTDTGELKGKLQVKGASRIWRMEGLEDSPDKMAILHGTGRKPKLLLVKLTQDLTLRVMPLGSEKDDDEDDDGDDDDDDDRFGLMSVQVHDGDNHRLVHRIRATTKDHAQISFTRAGCVLVDSLQKLVVFLDDNDRPFSGSKACKDPRNAVSSSWGHILVADRASSDIKVFSDGGDLLGTVEGTGDGELGQPEYIHYVEGERRLYAVCWRHGRRELLVYGLAPSQLPLPVIHSLTKVDTSVNIAKV